MPHNCEALPPEVTVVVMIHIRVGLHKIDITVSIRFPKAFVGAIGEGRLGVQCTFLPTQPRMEILFFAEVSEETSRQAPDPI